METPKNNPPTSNEDKAMEGRQIAKDGTDLKDNKFHEIDMGVDEDVALENLREFLKKKE